MKIIITGATGLVGRALTRDLLDRGHRVEAWTRSPAAAALRLPARCAVVGWDPDRIDPKQLSGADAVVHLAGENVAGGRWSAERKRALRSSRIDTARALVRAIAALPPSERPASLLSASAVGFYGDRGDAVLAEEASPGEGFMPELCRDWERAAAEVERAGVRAAMLRIGVVLDREEGMLATLMPVFRLGLGGRIGSGRQWMSWIHLDDVVGLFRHVLENPEIRGPVNAVAPEPVRNAEFTRAFARILGRPAPFPVPAAALRLAVGEMSAIMTSSQRVEPAVARSTGYEFRHPSAAEALGAACATNERELVFEQIVDAPIEEAFGFFGDARNLEPMTPPFLHFEITSIPEGPLSAGAHIEYRLRLRGIPVRWRTLIQSWNAPHEFVDVQERGPYSSWHHRHEFETTPEGTLVRDRVRYRLPLGALGDVVAGRWVRRDLDRIFRFRREQLPKLLSRRAEAA